MNLVLFRYHASLAATNGWLAADASHYAFILERPLRLQDGRVNVQQECAFPAGAYTVTLRYSEHFKKVMPLITGIPGRDGCELHCGEKEADSLGCPLMGIRQVSETEIVSGLGVGLTDTLVSMIKAAGGTATLQVINSSQVNAFLNNGVA